MSDPVDSVVASRAAVVAQVALLAVIAAVAVFLYSSTSNSISVPTGNIPNGPAYQMDMSSATSTPPMFEDFRDVDGNSVHAESIETITRLRITTGTSAATFSPSAPVSRAQMATFAARTWTASGRECPTSGAVAFADVPEGAAHAESVACTSALGVTRGTAAGTFSPSAPVTRAQMATFLVRLWRADGRTCPTSGGASFDDVPADSTHAESIRCISALGITRGTAAGTFSPSDSVTRAQMATFLTRFYDALTDADS